MASHQGGSQKNPTQAPLSPLLATGNLDRLVSILHMTAADLGLPAGGFSPITPATISTLSMSEQMLLPLLCTSLQSSVYIATALENLSTESHDLSSQVAHLDLSPQPPNLAPLQASLGDIASRLPSAAQASFPPQHPNVPQQATHTYRGSHPAPTATPTALAKRKERKELLWLHHHHCLIQSGLSPPLTRIFRDMTCQLPLPHYMATKKRLPKNTPTPGKRWNSPKGKTPPRSCLDPRPSGPRLATPRHHSPQDHPHLSSGCRTHC